MQQTDAAETLQSMVAWPASSSYDVNAFDRTSSMFDIAPKFINGPFPSWVPSNDTSAHGARLQQAHSNGLSSDTDTSLVGDESRHTLATTRLLGGQACISQVVILQSLCI